MRASGLIPRGARPPLWREAGLLLCSAFYAFFAFFVVRDVVRSLFSYPLAWPACSRRTYLS